MAWLDKLKGAVFVDEGGAQAKTSEPTTIKASNIGQNIGQGGGHVGNFSAPQVNPEFVAAIKKAVFGRNTALTQLMASADKMASIIPDAGTRLKAAFATMADGRTVKQVIDAVEVHLADVDGQEMQFKNALDAKTQSQCGTLDGQASTLANQIQQSQAEIETAQQRISALTASIGQLSQQHAEVLHAAATRRQELDQAALQFKQAAQAVRNELNGHKATIVSALS